MSNRFLCPISFASKMGYWSPVIWKVECVKVEDIKIGLLWCLDIPKVNYHSISKQEGFKFRFNPKLYLSKPNELKLYTSIFKKGKCHLWMFSNENFCVLMNFNAFLFTDSWYIYCGLAFDFHGQTQEYGRIGA